MKIHRTAVYWLLWLGIAVVALDSAVSAQFYAVSNLGSLGGTNTMAYGMNNHERVVGTSQTAPGDYHAFAFEGGMMMDLGSLGGSNSWCYGVNDMGWAVGAAELPATNMHAFLCTNAFMNRLMLDMGTLGGSNSVAWMINRHGEVVGWTAMSNGSHHAFFMTNSMAGHMMDLGTAGGANSEAYCINSNRMVVGFEMMPDGATLPIMSTNAMFGSSSMMTMGMEGMSATGGQFWSVNDLGQTAGQAGMAGGNHHAFVSGNGGMMGRMNMDLGTLGGSNSVAYCINNSGSAVGMAELTNGVHHAFLVTNALGGNVQMMDLNRMVPTNSGWELMEARAINNAEQIVGWGMHGGRTNAFLLTPVSAPVMVLSAPSARLAGPGATVTVLVQMSASEPLTYQWLHDGVAIVGATNAMLTLPEMASGNAGLYTITVRNAVGTVATSSAAVGMFSMVSTGGGALLRVSAPNGTRFRIDSSDTLAAGGNWHTLTNLFMSGSMNQLSVATSTGPRAGFYRAVMFP